MLTWGIAGNGGPVLFAGQKPYPTWPRAVTLADDSPCDPPAKEPVALAPPNVAPGARRRPVIPIVLGLVGFGVVALGLVGFLVSIASRPAPSPSKTAAAALPALEAAPPLAVATSNSGGKAVDAEESLARLEPPPPIQIGVPQEDRLEIVPPPNSNPLVEAPPSSITPPPTVFVPVPPPRPLELAPPGGPAINVDQATAVYDISAHTVYLPDGMRLEAHSGLGDRIDDPRFVDERDHGATPPGVYQLTLRESLFHGVQALRLNPVSGGFTFNRVGLLAHPYMLGPNGDSNGCVSFKTYDVFLRAFQSGEVKRLAVVARWTGGPRQSGLFASLGQAR